MAYSNIGTPRFYINVVEWLSSNNAIELDGGSNWNNSVWNTLPVEKQNYQSNYIDGYTHDIRTNGLLNWRADGKVFLALLGANINPGSWSMYHDDVQYFSNAITSIANMPQLGSEDGFGGGGVYSGFHIGEFSHYGVNDFALKIKTSDAGKYIGSIVLGTYYDMPHSPDLKLTMTREMDGVKRIRTKGGADLVKHQYIKPAMWGDAGAWELYEDTPVDRELSRAGRRGWGLSFNYLQDSDIFPEISNLSWAEAYYNGTPYDASTAAGKTLLDDDTFYGQVIHRTNGGQLPFIFQPDVNNNNDFAIAKFDMKEFKFKQVANGVYNMKLKIREVW